MKDYEVIAEVTLFVRAEDEVMAQLIAENTFCPEVSTIDTEVEVTNVQEVYYDAPEIEND